MRKRELLIVENDTGAVKMRADVTGWDEKAVGAKAAELRGLMAEEGYHLVDTRFQRVTGEAWPD